MERRGIGRVELRELLLSGLKEGSDPVVHWGKSFAHYEHLAGNQIRVHFADTSTEDADVLIGADGCNSKVREQYLPTLQREDLGVLAIAGRYILDQDRTRDLPRSFIDGSLNNIVPHGKGWMFITSWTSNSTPTASSGVAEPSEHYVMWAYVVPKTDTPVNAKEMTASQLQAFALSGT